MKIPKESLNSCETNKVSYKSNMGSSSKQKNGKSFRSSGRTKQGKKTICKEKISNELDKQKCQFESLSGTSGQKKDVIKCEIIQFDEESNSFDNKEIEKLIIIMDECKTESSEDDSVSREGSKNEMPQLCDKRQKCNDQKTDSLNGPKTENDNSNLNLQINLELSKVKIEMIGTSEPIKIHPNDTKESLNNHIVLPNAISERVKKSKSGLTSKKGKKYISKGGLSKKISNQQIKVLHILDLPNEILTKILKYLPYFEVGKNRRVCKRFEVLGADILNNAFQRLQQKLLHRFQQIKAKMPRRESARRRHPLARESDIIETLHMRLTLLQMSFGKHIEKKHCCFFAGEILDEILNIMSYVKTVPSLGRAYKVTDELFDLTTMAMEYFKEHIEPTLPEINYFSSDFIDINAPTSNTSARVSSSSSLPGPSETKRPSCDNLLQDQRVSKLKQKLKICLSDIDTLKKELKITKEKLSEQQKQVVEFGSKFEQYDKKYEESACQFAILLREYQSCKKELQAFRQNYVCRPVPPSPQHISISIEEQESPHKIETCDGKQIPAAKPEKEASPLIETSESVSLVKETGKLASGKRKSHRNDRNLNKKMKMSVNMGV